MSSSSDQRPDHYPAADRPDLRTGVWTRLGDTSVLGDEVTEAALGGLAERTRSAARAQGYAVGWAEGRREALALAADTAAVVERRHHDEERRREREHRAALDALAAAAASLSGTAREVSARIADQATELAFELTRTLVGHELATEADPGAAVVARMIAALPHDTTAVVRVHPATADSEAAGMLEEHGVRLVVDPGLDRHDAIVETDVAAIDLRVGTAIERLREALR